MQDQEPTDDDLIARAATGDRAAFECLVEQHAPAILRLARAMTPDEATAADVVQDALLAAYKSAGSYRAGVSSVRTWMFAIARNAARKARRSISEGRLVEVDAPLLSLGIAAGWGDTDATILRSEERGLLVRALSTLAPDDVEVILLRDVEDLSGDETAMILGLGLAALKSRLHRARLRLMAAMKTAEGGVMDHQRELGGLTCSEVLSALGDYVDGDLPSEGRARVDAHLRECGVCERFGGRYAGVVQAARARLGVPPAIDPAQLERIRRALGE